MAYVTSATTKGGRNGRAMLDNGALALAMAAPKEIGGAGDGHNPEQLFALGYSSCYGQAIMLIAKKYGLDGQAARVHEHRNCRRRPPYLPAEGQTQAFSPCWPTIPFGRRHFPARWAWCGWRFGCRSFVNTRRFSWC